MQRTVSCLEPLLSFLRVSAPGFGVMGGEVFEPLLGPSRASGAGLPGQSFLVSGLHPMAENRGVNEL